MVANQRLLSSRNMGEPGNAHTSTVFQAHLQRSQGSGNENYVQHARREHHQQVTQRARYQEETRYSSSVPG